MPYKDKIACVYGLFHNDICLYIGSTSDYKTRCAHHRGDCYNQNNKNYNIRLYKYIREKGGFDNFEFRILQEISDKSKLRTAEREYMQKYSPELNVYDVDIDCRHNTEYQTKSTMKSRKKNYEHYKQQLAKYKNKKYINPLNNKIQTLNTIQAYYYRRNLKFSIKNLIPINEEI